jgi:hypothetical protein
MKIVDGKKYFTSGDVAALCGKSQQQVNNWDKYSDQLEKIGGMRLIPKAEREKRIRWYTEAQAVEICQFSERISYGDIAPFSRTRIGTRGKEIDVKMNGQYRCQR